MNRPRKTTPDALAAVAWLAAALWGWNAVTQAADQGSDPSTVAAISNGHWALVSGWVLVTISVVMLLAALTRLVTQSGPIAPTAASLALAIALIVLFVALGLWGATATERGGTAAIVLILVPYFVAAVGVLFARRRRVDLAPTGRAFSPSAPQAR